MIKLNNPTYLETSYDCKRYLPEENENKKIFLKRKSEILAQILNDNIIGLGYTSYSEKRFTGRFPYENDEYDCINEYVIVNTDNGTLSKLNLAYMPISEINFYDQTEEGMGGIYASYIYKQELDELGYIHLPDNFKELEDDAIINLFEINKTKSKTK